MAAEKETEWPGERAKELGVVLGEIGCPHCGTVCSGALKPVCGFCDKPYWSLEIMEEFGYISKREQFNC